MNNPNLEQPTVSFPPVYEAVTVLFSEVSGVCSFHYYSTAGWIIIINCFDIFRLDEIG